MVQNIPSMDTLAEEILNHCREKLKKEFNEDIEFDVENTMSSIQIITKRPKYGRCSHLIWVDHHRNHGWVRCHLQHLRWTPVGNYDKVDTKGRVKYGKGMGNLPIIKAFFNDDKEYVWNLVRYAYINLFLKQETESKSEV